MHFELGQKIIDVLRGKKKIMTFAQCPFIDNLKKKKIAKNEMSPKKRKFYNKIFNTPIKKMKNGFVDITYNGVHFQGPFTQTLNTVYEVFFKNLYDFIIPSKSYLMIDIGFNMGITSLKFAQKEEVKKIYAYEPAKPTFDIAFNNLKLNPELAEKIEAHNIGLGDEDKEVEIIYNINYLTGASSFMKERLLQFSDESNKKTTETLVVKKASEVLKPILEKTKEKIFVKMDCEGAEFEIFEDLEKACLFKRIDIMIIEWHFKNPQRITEILQKNNFICFCDYAQSDGAGIIKAVKGGY